MRWPTAPGVGRGEGFEGLRHLRLGRAGAAGGQIGAKKPGFAAGRKGAIGFCCPMEELLFARASSSGLVTARTCPTLVSAAAAVPGGATGGHGSLLATLACAR
ncbi:hypothetical protein [Alloyangia pacifica]|uniref:hypothetical protein n=1 Tax=Alloyangia pacifica TaxID=311180 RepID=UPI001CFD4041|nr:hypothetical protein [Alloyangia pacifica]